MSASPPKTIATPSPLLQRFRDALHHTRHVLIACVSNAILDKAKKDLFADTFVFTPEELLSFASSKLEWHADFIPVITRSCECDGIRFSVSQSEQILLTFELSNSAMGDWFNRERKHSPKPWATVPTCRVLTGRIIQLRNEALDEELKNIEDRMVAEMKKQFHPNISGTITVPLMINYMWIQTESFRKIFMKILIDHFTFRNITVKVVDDTMNSLIMTIPE